MTTFAERVISRLSGVGWAGLARFHSQTLRSELPAARVCPSGLNATEVTVSVGPFRGRPSGVGRAGLARFHSQTLWSELPAARIRPSGLNATEKTAFMGPVNRLASGVVVVSISRVLVSDVALIWFAATSSWAASEGLVAVSCPASTVTSLAMATSRAASDIAA